jgi:hypothetical protein
MKFKGKSNGTNISCIGSRDQEIFDRGILAVFEGLLGFVIKVLYLTLVNLTEQLIFY